MGCLFQVLYILSGLLSALGVFGLVILSQTGNVGYREDWMQTAYLGILAMLFSVVVCSGIAYQMTKKDSYVTGFNILGLISMIFVPPLVGLITLSMIY